MYRNKNSYYYQLIHSAQWLKLRKQKLTDQPTCERCQSQHDWPVPATEVHHIMPCETARTHAAINHLMFSYANLMSLCHECHVAIHKEMRSQSKETIRLRNTARTNRFITRFLSPARKAGGCFLKGGAPP